LGSADPKKFKASLDRAEYFLNTARKSGHPLKVEFVVSSGGLNLLRTGMTPYADRIKSLQQSYDNLAFVACSQSIERLREKGGKVDLLPETTQSPDSALEVVVSRLRDGWTYVSI
jgi:intracellular sulfur oxidation DsrE/DsrF family protein